MPDKRPFDGEKSRRASLLPKQMRYQAALCPDGVKCRKGIEKSASRRKRRDGRRRTEANEKQPCGTQSPAKVPQNVADPFTALRDHFAALTGRTALPDAVQRLTDLLTVAMTQWHRFDSAARRALRKYIIRDLEMLTLELRGI